MRTGAELVRFVVPSRIDRDSQVPIGVIGAAYDLLDEDHITADLASELRRWLAWFSTNVPIPDRFNRTTSKGWYRRDTRGISWLRASATDALAALAQLVDVVRRCGLEVTELRTQRPGYVVYEDELQVVAEPFRDTPTR